MENDIILKINNVAKKYPGVLALDDVSFDLRRGEVLALIGENGAGKSTIIKALTGAIKPSSGSIEFEGETYTSFTPALALDKGIVAIYQEFNLINYLTVGENIFFGHQPTKRGFINKKKMFNDAKEILERTGVDIPVNKQVSKLGTSHQQIVEIAKALSRKSKLLIMDEPSATLTNTEIVILHNVIRRLKSEGVSIIYISHKLEEVFEISDRTTVLRDGKLVCTKDTSELTRDELIKHMVGRTLNEVFPDSEYSGENKEVLRVENLTNDYFNNISFSLYEGEILGIGGLVGAGRTEVLRAIFGVDPITSGDIFIRGEKVEIKKPIDAIKDGIGLIPEDRKMQGLFLMMSVKDNITIASMQKIERRGFIRKGEERRLVSNCIDDLRIKTPSQIQLVRNLSGGNQQKVVLSKWLSTDSDIYFFDEPTRGIDVNAKQEIYELMRNLIRNKKSIIMVSSEMPELIGMADRIIVMAEGSQIGCLDRSEANQEKIMQMASSKNIGGV